MAASAGRIIGTTHRADLGSAMRSPRALASRTAPARAQCGDPPATAGTQRAQGPRLPRAVRSGTKTPPGR